MELLINLLLTGVCVRNFLRIRQAILNDYSLTERVPVAGYYAIAVFGSAITVLLLLSLFVESISLWMLLLSLCFYSSLVSRITEDEGEAACL